MIHCDIRPLAASIVHACFYQFTSSVTGFTDTWSVQNIKECH